MRDLWQYRWNAMGMFGTFYLVFWIGTIFHNPLWIVGTIGVMVMVIIFLIISSSHNGLIAKRRSRNDHTI